MSTVSTSPEFIQRSVAGFGVIAANGGENADNGSGAACGTPLCVMNANETGSMPTRFRQSWLFGTPVLPSWLRLSIVSAAHHLVASQLTPGGQGTQPGG